MRPSIPTADLKKVQLKTVQEVLFMALMYLGFPITSSRVSTGGTGDDAYELANKMSAAWINFAKTGDPNENNVLPAWKPYSRENGVPMIFDKEPKIVNNHDRKLMHLVKPLT